MTKKPLLKQFGDLKKTDFLQYPVWVNCHVIDYNEPWYEETNEETFRPWGVKLPIDNKEISKATFLVKASFALADGTKFSGFVTPQKEKNKNLIEKLLSYKDPVYLGTVQPQIFINDSSFVGFWNGIFKAPENYLQKFCDLFKKKPEDIFPISFSADPNLSSGITKGIIKGVYFEKGEKILS